MTREEYKLSFAASEIDEKLRKIDSLVSSVNGVTPDENGNVEINGGNAALTSNGKALLRTLLNATVYDNDVLPNPKFIIDQFLAELDEKTDSGDIPDIPDTTYAVIYKLTGVISANKDTSITEGCSFTTVLSAESAIDTVTVMMGDVDITSMVYNNISNTITIEKVTGDIKITAAISDQTMIYSLKDASFNGSTIVDTGVALFDESKDFTILFDTNNIDCSNQAAYFGLIEDEEVSDSYRIFLGKTGVLNKNLENETINANFMVNNSILFNVVEPGSMTDRIISIKAVITFDSATKKWVGCAVNKNTGERVDGTLTTTISTIPNTIGLGGTSYRGKTAFTCNEFSIYNRVLSDDEINTWMQ